ncbi:acetamidase/formamidase [Aeropyrum pernix K1]|uniref:Acetamidase/formamidase n=1 Tax=Aeropyrum pernix (strain ATCC 700893 / DSM 11879 / JCM 9820 / NBRC 100138 / K1) TaxID=272557 RepID=Q9YEQ1_AERPE|nr:acetamidase/formamidase family protein [Aeropyrum pernix]BAA79495.1 acetamidase/formamidase [Aeropyrum pernix K1]
MVTRITINRGKRCVDEADRCHNRWHPDIEPAAEVDPGDIVVIETRDALDGQITANPGVDDVASADLNVVHPLTGPVYVRGAKPGDLLVVEVLDIKAEPFGFTVAIPGFGFLRDLFDKPYKIRWRIEGGYAFSEDLPNVRIPGDPFLGVMGVAPSKELLKEIKEREDRLLKRGGFVLPPTPEGAVPPREPVASEGLRTIPPRENGGNLDVRHFSPGSKIYFPVFVEGALFSVGDAHYAQGDGEVCGTAIEMGATATLRFGVISEGAKKYGIRFPIFKPSESSVRRFTHSKHVAVTGVGVIDSLNESENATLSAKHALLNLINLLEKAGYTREQAYLLASVAADLRLSQLVDVPNFTVTAFLPLDIFIEPPEVLKKLAE